MVARWVAELIGDCCTINVIDADGSGSRPIVEVFSRELDQDRVEDVIKDREAAVRTLVAPLIASGPNLGTITLSRNEGRDPFTREDEFLVQGVADRIAIGLENSRLLEVARWQDHQLRALTESTTQMVQARDRSCLLTAILDNVVGLTGAHAASVWLVDDQRDNLKLEMVRGARGRGVKPGTVTNQGLAWDALQSGTIVRVGDFQSFPHPIGWQADIARARSAVAIPLVARQESIGALVVWSREPANFSPTYDNILSTLAEHAALGIVQSLEIAARVVLEEQLIRSHKMEAIGRLAGGVAHDFNNLLTTISGFGELALLRLPPRHPVREYVDQIVQAGERASALTRQLLSVSRRQPVELRVLDLNAVVLDTERMLRRVIREDIDVTTTLPPTLGRVEADPSQIQQIVMNLILNARDAMPSAGLLTVETANVDVDASNARMHATVRPGSYVLLAVTDTGIGMDAETLAQIFEPFFTTKAPGSGTGLGLSTVYGIVKQSGGDISVQSEADRGTTFKIYLPRVDSLADLARAPHVTHRLRRGTETVLVIEDEERLRSLACLVLTEAGYNVLEAPRGDVALDVAERHQGTIDLVLTDLVMPGLSGHEIAERLQARYPRAKVLFMSGYTDDTIVRCGRGGDVRAFLEKPFTPAGLTRKVRQVLDSIAATG